MIVDDKLLSKLEKLSALKIPDEKKDSIKSQLNEIVQFVDILNSVDLDGIDLTSTTLGTHTPLRKDIPSENKEVIEIILKNAPASENHFFVVPKIIE